MSNQNLLDASENGDIKSIQQLITNQQLDINCRDV